MTEPLFSLADRRVWVAGHGGMVGSALCRRLDSEPCDVVTAGRDSLDLTRQKDVEAWLAETKPEVIFVAAARVGGIHANDSRPAEFIGGNLQIQTNVIDAAYRIGVRKLIFLGSSCIYPTTAAQPIREEALLTGPLEPTNEWYAIAKIAGIKMCQAYRRQYGCDFISVQPTNLYGYNDNFDLESSHVIPALLAKAHRAKVGGSATMQVWGSGRPQREFLFADDLADALVFMARNYSADRLINVGSGQELSIREVATLIADVVGFEGTLAFDATRPDGIPRKLLDSSRIHALGWRPSTSLREGLEKTYAWFLANSADARL